MNEPTGPAAAVSSPPSEPSPCPSSFAEVVDWFCDEQEEFRAILALMGDRGVHPRSPLGQILARTGSLDGRPGAGSRRMEQGGTVGVFRAVGYQPPRLF